LPTAKIPRRSTPRSFQTGSEAWEMFLEPLGNVICVEDGELRERVHGLNFKMLSAQQFSMRAIARKKIKLRVAGEQLRKPAFPDTMRRASYQF
jgi:hypothetical protein